jgi:hypothetical protein
MYYLKEMYCSRKGNAGSTEIIVELENLEEITEIWKYYCEKNSTQEYFDKKGYNCFYIENDDGEIIDAHDTGYYYSCIFDNIN